jgi:hypothetical protein
MDSIVVKKVSQDGKIAYITFVDGRDYKLQHPGNRVYMEWEQEFVTMTGINMTQFMDKAFEYCVVPDNHAFKPSIDNIKPREVGAWQKVLRQFLGGDFSFSLEEFEKNSGRKRDSEAIKG